MRARHALLLLPLLGCAPSPVAPAAQEVALPARAVAPAPAPEPPPAPPRAAPSPESPGGDDAPVQVVRPQPALRPLTDEDQDLMRVGIRRVQPRLRSCYAHALEGSPALTGRLAVDLEVGDDGSVRATVLSTTVPAPLSACVLSAFRGLRLPSGHGGGSLRIPIVFSN